MSAPKRLIVLMRGIAMGVIEQAATGKITFTYDEDWLARGGGALSLSMPRLKARHDGPAVANFLWGLLPDNPHALGQIAADSPPVSPNNVMGLLDRVGDDVAGAIQIVSETRLHGVESAGDVVDSFVPDNSFFVLPAVQL